MKKVMIFMVLASIAFSGCGQKGLVTKSQNLKDTGKLEEALQNINQAVDPTHDKADKTIDWPRTWEVRGEVYQAVYQSENEEVKNLVEDPLTEALKSYKKALELDDKGRFENSVKVKLTLLTNDLTNQAVEAFNDENYPRALQSFEQILDVQEIDIIKRDNPDVVDTVIIFNAGLAAYNAENYDKAIEYYREAAKYGYNEARTYSLIANAYQLQKDTLGALAALQEGFEKYPEDNTVLTSMIQIYLDLDKTEDAMRYLDMAIQQDPGNATFYFAQGTLYEKVENEDKAIEAYENAIENDEEFFNAYYNLGALYYNKGVKQIEVANSIPTSNNQEYEVELKKADKWFREALPYMEKCHELKPDDNMSMESLKNLYYRLKDMENYNRMLEKLGQS
ncbi:tetratricopeptide repeat protein [Mariniphaga sp.]|uniref:tetratricopeptide repeat protein n=1 Tax=Mariniphaga sp. TaxID=1954475 RepID=UPI00356749AC